MPRVAMAALHTYHRIGIDMLRQDASVVLEWARLFSKGARMLSS